MKLLAIDGNSIMNRAFYGIKMLSNKKGVYTNALTGFMNIYLAVAGELDPDGVAVAFDLRATRRLQATRLIATVCPTSLLSRCR